jgi:hypothetical protein
MAYSASPDASTAPQSSAPVAQSIAGPNEHVADICLADSLGRRMHHALNELRAARVIVVSDDHDPEDEADLIMAAEKPEPRARPS